MRHDSQAVWLRGASAQATEFWCILRTAPKHCSCALRLRDWAQFASPPTRWRRARRSRITPKRHAQRRRSRRRALPSLVSSHARDVRWVVAAERESAAAALRRGTRSLRCWPPNRRPPIRHSIPTPRPSCSPPAPPESPRGSSGRMRTFCGVLLQRPGVWPQGRGRQSDIAAAVSRCRALLVVPSGPLGGRHGRAAAPVLGEPILAGVDRASRDADISRSLHVDGAAKPDRCRSGISTGSGPSPAVIANRNPSTGFRPSCRRGG